MLPRPWPRSAGCELMMSAPVTMALLGAVASIAIAAACVATWRARAARRAGDRTHAERVDLARTVEADSRLADEVAHDLNDLLTAITGHAELLLAGLDPSGAGIRDAYEIRRAALSAVRLTKPLRTLSGGRRAPADVIDVNAVTARTVASLRPMLGSNIDVTLALDPDIKRVKVGASQLEAIVLNLCVHARDAMPGGGRLTITTGMRAERVRVVVGDTSDAGRGSAISLSKVDAIVQEAGGRIQVSSTPALGTMVTVDFPATSESTVAPERVPAERRMIAPVLVVEDEPGMREFIRLVLTRAGHEVVTVAGPRAALDALSRQPAISLMLVDVVMPEMDGYEVVAEARKLSPGVHVVFVSAFAPDPARQSSGDAFLAKPFTSESLTGTVERALAY